MFEEAEDFFMSMGLPPMTEAFWNGSLLERPKDGREVVCHASAWDFQNRKDFRIKMCTEVNMGKFRTVNHEMGHTQYQMAYKNLSFFHRSGANPAFHEGVADITFLAAGNNIFRHYHNLCVTSYKCANLILGTASHYKHLGLLSKDVDASDEKTEINILFQMALERLSFLPYGYVVDKYRWDLYKGLADEKNMNCHWAKLRMDIQGTY